MKKRWMTRALVLAMLGLSGGVASAEVYELTPVLVTATRYEKEDVRNGASTQIFTEEQIRKTGQVNLQQALGFLDHVTYDGMGPNGSAISSMTSEIIMRGVSNGTVVLMNGTPINWRGKYNLEDIPVGSVDRVEVVRGGGSVLYGSQAKGGVINIITKKQLPNEVSIGLGDYGQQNYQVSLGTGDLSFAYTYSKMGDTGLISSTWPTGKPGKTGEMRQRFVGNEKNDFFLTYRLADRVNVMYNHDETSTDYEYTFQRGWPEELQGKPRYDRDYERKKDFVQLNVSDWDGWSGHVYYNRNTLATEGTDYYGRNGELQTKNKKGKITATYPKPTSKKEKNLSYGYDVQKVWKDTGRTLLAGTSYERNEFYDYEDPQKQRNILSLFASWEEQVRPADTLTLSGRYTWTTGATENKNFHDFSGQAQYVHLLSNDQSVYASVGQSFVLPTFSAMYSGVDDPNARIHGDPTLRPEKGRHYELGWKKDMANGQYRAAFFVTRIKDNISYTTTRGDIYPKNENFRNYGLELGMSRKENEHLTWHTALTLQNPESKTDSQKKGSKNYWDRKFGRVMLNAGFTYQKDKWTATCNANYLAERVLSPSSSHSFSEKPYLLTAMTVTYAPNDSSDVTLTINNVLNREDNINHSSSYYATLPTYYLLTYRLRW